MYSWTWILYALVNHVLEFGDNVPDISVQNVISKPFWEIQNLNDK